MFIIIIIKPLSFVHEMGLEYIVGAEPYLSISVHLYLAAYCLFGDNDSLKVYRLWATMILRTINIYQNELSLFIFRHKTLIGKNSILTRLQGWFYTENKRISTYFSVDNIQKMVCFYIDFKSMLKLESSKTVLRLFHTQQILF